jgi:hypothetical protein
MLNVAVTCVSPLIVIGQGSVPLQTDQPANEEAASGGSETGVAVRVTVESYGNEPEQADPQLIPDGLLVTAPEPVPAFVIVSV